MDKIKYELSKNIHRKSRNERGFKAAKELDELIDNGLAENTNLRELYVDLSELSKNTLAFLEKYGDTGLGGSKNGIYKAVYDQVDYLGISDALHGIEELQEITKNAEHKRIP